MFNVFVEIKKPYYEVRSGADGCKMIDHHFFCEDAAILEAKCSGRSCYVVKVTEEKIYSQNVIGGGE